MSFDATFWALIALVLFIALVVYLKVPGQVAAMLDKRGEGIRKELDEARALREEAAKLLAEYQRRRKEAEEEAAAIVSQAKREAEVMAKEAEVKMEDYLKRRSAHAEFKISQAEHEAIQEVREKTVQIAVAAAESLLRENIPAATAEMLINDGIQKAATQLKN